MLKGIIASPRMMKYLESLDTRTKEIHKLANEARTLGIDPELYVDVPLAANAAERVEGLISSVEPRIIGKGIPERIAGLEKQYGPGDWRVALIIAAEIAQNKYIKFDEKLDAITIGVRTGLAYITQGTVSAPLEGVVELKFKKRKDGKDYLAIYFAGPIRGAGGTAQSVSVLIADYVRKELGIAAYDPTETEIKRYYTETMDYYDRVERKQYRPSALEMEMIISNVKVELNGDPTSQLEVSNYKHLERVETNNIRGGLALILTDGIPLKAAKLWAQLRNWGKDFGLEHWNWLVDFLKLKEKLHAKAKKKDSGDEEKIKPDYIFLSEMVAGRPVFTYPLARGGFRLRYGRTRATGHGAWAISPVTMQVLNDYLATGTQLRVERPGKSTALTVCDSINGPIVKLEDGSVVRLETEAQAKKVRLKIQEILFIGDLLISHGDFFEQGHMLIPAGYCHEWWLKEAAKAGFELTVTPTLEAAKKLAEKIPLHPDYTFFWSEISIEHFKSLYSWLKTAKQTDAGELILEITEAKRALELIGCPHKVKDDQIILEKTEADILRANLSDFKKEIPEASTTLEIVNKISEYKIKDLAGYTIGCRMGRPEKAKLRKMKGSPHVLFPVGKEGGRLRSFQCALENGKVVSDFPIFECEKCKSVTIYPICENCGEKTEQWRVCPICKKKTKKAKCHKETVAYEKTEVDICNLFRRARIMLEINKLPALIKGVRGTSNKDHLPEHLAKGILRSKHKLHVNKDGTVRYDLSELPITHIRPKEIGLSIEKAKELGYDKDIHGNELSDTNQVIEMFPQDIILPACEESGDEGADKIFLRTSKFVDDELTYIYKKKPFYNTKSKSDLIGQLVIGLAPHTSAGIIARILGFAKVVCILAHPYFHSAMRRDCDGEETSILLVMDCFLNFSRQYLPDHRGGRSMDAPLVLTTVLNPMEVDDECYFVNTCWDYPLEFYEAAEQFKNPWELKVEMIKSRVGKPEQYEGMGFTHSISDINAGVLVSAYKSIPTMLEKVGGQMDLAKKIRAVDFPGTASLIVEKHFIRDIKGNLRKFTFQGFRCINCNAKYRRPPLSGTCSECSKGKLVFTIAEGSIKKYLEHSIKLSKLDGVTDYLRQTIELLKARVDSVFGEEKTKQIGLGEFC